MKSSLTTATRFAILAIAVAGLLFSACKSAGSKSTPSADQKIPLLLFQKTPCFGICPSYEALIHTNGYVQFVPWKHVPATDTLTFQLTEGELKSLNEDLNDLNYKSLKDLYKTDWSDMPATHLYFYEAGKEVKHIKHEEGGLEKLAEFNEKVHQLIWKYVATPDR